MRTLIGLAVVGLLCAGTGWEARAATGSDLLELSLEELMNVEVTSVSKKGENLSETAAAVFVITAEDIRRSGVTSIPDALRMVPGLHVARIDANKWAISARGFSGRFANKLLVLIDGRTVYSSMYSGVFWESQDVLLRDIDRIEVIRGPGATLWGSNAVNGVINIITKNAAETQGAYATLGAGSSERAFTSARYGGRAGDRVRYRVYAKYFDRDHTVLASNEDAFDGWNMLRSGFRMDLSDGDGPSVTFQGDLYSGDAMQTTATSSLVYPYRQTQDDTIGVSGGNLLGRWTRPISGTSSLVAQVYYDRSIRHDPLLDLETNTLDIDVHHLFDFGRRHRIVWGVGYRLVDYNLGNTFSCTFPDETERTNFVNLFAQDEVWLSRNRVRLTFGSKFEYHGRSEREIQPNVRLAWTPSDHQTLWAAASRAARTPSLAELKAQFVMEAYPPGKYYPDRPAIVVLRGDEDYESEYIRAYELGYRVRPAAWFSVDMAAFYNDYDNLRSGELLTPYLKTSPSPPHLVIPFSAFNKAYGESYGAELAADWQIAGWWRLHTSYSHLKMKIHFGQGSDPAVTENMQGESPQGQAFVHSSMRLEENLDLDLSFRWVDRLEFYDIDSYSALDARVGWSPVKPMTVSVVGLNLFGPGHKEFRPEIYDTPATLNTRGYYTSVTWEF